MKQTLENIKYFLLDMDGTIYLGDKKIGEMDKTLEKIRNSGKKIIYLTNNSSKSGVRYIEKLKKLGLWSDEDVVYTSGMATIEYLHSHHKGKSVYLVGTPELVEEFKKCGINLTDNMPDVAVLAYDTTLTYDKLVKFTNYVTKGAFYVATHPDINCPAPDVYHPDIGSFIALIEKSTGKLPKVICGKPYTFMGDSIMRSFGANPSEIVMVGDRLSTDLVFAKNNNFNSILVLSGETTQEMYDTNNQKADFVLNSLNDIII